MRPIVVLFALLVAANTAEARQAAMPVQAGMHLTGAAHLTPGTYRLDDPGTGVIEVTGRNFTLDMRGVVLAGPGKGHGVAVHVVDARNVHITGLTATGYQFGVVVERSSGVTLTACNASRNADLAPGTVIDESGTEPEDNHGAGFVLRDCVGCALHACTAVHQWDGVDVVRSTGCRIDDGDYSWNGNWGVHFWNSSKNVFQRNRAIWCTTGSGLLFQALTGWQTYDAQAVGIDHNSNENQILDNDLRFGGDGIFIRANEGPITPGTVVPPRNGSHRNVLRGNDCSFSPNNAIEVDLVDDTVIEDNNCSWSNYGMWLGYSRRCIVRGNICVNDSSHAVEIENGQDDLFDHNVFGYDVARADAALVYLRQNGRDKTPSKGYRLTGNLFYGGGTGLLLKDTGAELSGNRLVYEGPGSASMVRTTGARMYTETSTALGASGASMAVHLPGELQPGRLVTFALPARVTAGLPAVVEIDGVPLWVRRARSGAVTVIVPEDNWDRPASDAVRLTVRTAAGVAGAPASVQWGTRRRVTGVSPNPATLSDRIAVSGYMLDGGTVFLNGAKAEVLSSTADGITVGLPAGLLVATRFNVVVAGQGWSTWPVTLSVNVPHEREPHLVSATFTPAELHVGDVLSVTFTVRNNLPYAVRLTTTPRPPYVWDEHDAYWERGFGETAGALHVRVSSDRPARHDSGSWPWMFGFDRDSLGPGEEATVTGGVRLETAGDRTFRIGLVAGGARFIDDNAFQTHVHVLP